MPLERVQGRPASSSAASCLTLSTIATCQQPGDHPFTQTAMFLVKTAATSHTCLWCLFDERTEARKFLVWFGIR